MGINHEVREGHEEIQENKNLRSDYWSASFDGQNGLYGQEKSMQTGMYYAVSI